MGTTLAGLQVRKRETDTVSSNCATRMKSNKKGKVTAEWRKRRKVKQRRRETTIEATKRQHKRSAVVRAEGVYALVDESRNRTDKVTRGDDERVSIGKEVLEVSTGASNHEKWTIGAPVALHKQMALADPIENTTPETPKNMKVPQKRAPAPDTGNYSVLRGSQLDYTILARQERETEELTFWLLPKATTVLVTTY